MTTASIQGVFFFFNEQQYKSDVFQVLLDYLDLTKLSIELSTELVTISAQETFTICGKAILFSQESGIELDIVPRDDGQCDFLLVATLPDFPQDVLSKLPGPFPAALHGVKNVTFTFDSSDQLAYFMLMESNANHEGIEGLPLKNLGFEYLQNGRTKNPLSLDVHAEIDVGTTPVQVVLSAPLGGDLGPKVWQLKSPTVIPMGSGLTEMASLIAKAVGIRNAEALFPKSLGDVSVFFLDELTILLNFTPVHIEFLTFRLTSMRQLVLIPDKLAIEKIGVRMNITPGRNSVSTTTALTLFGTIDIDDKPVIHIDISVPTDVNNGLWTFIMTSEAELDGINALEKLPLGVHQDELHLDPGFLDIKSLAIEHFEMDFNPLQGKVSDIRFVFFLCAVCRISHGFEVSNPRLSFAAQNPFSDASLGQKQITGQIAATINWEDIEFFVEATKQADRYGWAFLGKTS